MRIYILLFLLCSSFAKAQEQDFQALTFDCYDQAKQQGADLGRFGACIGITSNACMEADPDFGYTTRGMDQCVQMETNAWDVLLNQEWGKAKTLMQTLDAEDAENGQPSYAIRWESLLNAQRSWLAFRKAECDFQYVQWGSGSIRSNAYNGCMLDLTARRVFDLHALTITY
ncbi:MAG: lysozyme inhibitor LprI family protein [Planktomarina sp.]